MRRTQSLGAIALISCAIALAGACKNIESDQTTNNTAVYQSTIGANGGRVELEDGAALIIPPGALDTDITFTIKRGAPDAPAKAASDPAFLGEVYSFEPHGTVFKLPATVRIPILAASGDARLAHANPGGNWENVESSPLKDEKLRNLREAQRSSLSFFALWPAPTTADGGPGADTGIACPPGPLAGAPKGTTTVKASMPLMGGGSLVVSPVDGWAKRVATEDMGGLETTYYSTLTIDLTDYAAACGYRLATVSTIAGMVGYNEKNGSKHITVQIEKSSTTGPVVWKPETLDVFGSPSLVRSIEIMAVGYNAMCFPQRGSMLSPGMPPSPALQVQITAIDDTHVAGTFLGNAGNGSISGDFDVPFCPDPMGIVRAGNCCFE